MIYWSLNADKNYKCSLLHDMQTNDKDLCCMNALHYRIWLVHTDFTYKYFAGNIQFTMRGKEMKYTTTIRNLVCAVFAVMITMLVIICCTGCQKKAMESASIAPTINITPSISIQKPDDGKVSFSQVIPNKQMVSMTDALGRRNYFKFKYRDSRDGKTHICLLNADWAKERMMTHDWQYLFEDFAVTAETHTRIKKTFGVSQEQFAQFMAERERSFVAQNISSNAYSQSNSAENANSPFLSSADQSLMMDGMQSGAIKPGGIFETEAERESKLNAYRQQRDEYQSSQAIEIDKTGLSLSTSMGEQSPRLDKVADKLEKYGDAQGKEIARRYKNSANPIGAMFGN